MALPAGVNTTEELMQVMKMYKEGGGEMDPSKVPEDVRPFVQSFQQFEGLDTTKMNFKGMNGSGGADQSADVEEIVPEPGFVVKCRDDNDRKIFINICGAEKVAAPGGWENGKVPDDVLAQLEDASISPDESLRFPLSLGEQVYDLDKKGQPCSCFDCVFNSDVVKQALQVKRLKHFLVELAITWIQQKHDLILDPKFKLPRLKYKGSEIQTQNIRRVKGKGKGKGTNENGSPLISEIGGDNDDENVSIPLCTKPRVPTVARREGQDKLKAPVGGEDTRQDGAGTLSIALDFEGSPATAAAVTVKLDDSWDVPELAAALAKDEAKKVQVSLVGCDLVEVTVPSSKADQCVSTKVPFAVDCSRAQASLDVKSRTISATFPYKSVSEVIEEMRREAPHQFGSLKLSDSSFLDLE